MDLTPIAAALVKAMAGDAPPRRTSLSDMADDAIGLLDHLGIERAHVVGASMGGMIVQTMAIEHPERGAHADVDHVDHRRARRTASPTPRSMARAADAAADDRRARSPTP